MTESENGPAPKLPEEEEKVEVRLTKQIVIIFAVCFVLVGAAVIIELDLGILTTPLIAGILCVAGLVGVSYLFCDRKSGVFTAILVYAIAEVVALIAAIIVAVKVRAIFSSLYFPDGCPEETPGLEEVPDTRAKVCNKFYSLSTSAVALYFLGIIFHIALIVPTYKLKMIMKNAVERRFEKENIHTTQQPQGEPLQQMPIAAPQGQVLVQPQAVQQPQGWVQPLAQPQTAAPQQGVFYTTTSGGGQQAQPQALYYPVAAPYTNSNPGGDSLKHGGI